MAAREQGEGRVWRPRAGRSWDSKVQREGACACTLARGWLSEGSVEGAGPVLQCLGALARALLSLQMDQKYLKGFSEGVEMIGFVFQKYYPG